MIYVLAIVVLMFAGHASDDSTALSSGNSTPARRASAVAGTVTQATGSLEGLQPDDLCAPFGGERPGSTTVAARNGL